MQAFILVEQEHDTTRHQNLRIEHEENGTALQPWRQHCHSIYRSQLQHRREV
jgi:hypothetical protein